MIVVENAKALALKLNQPDRVLNCIPSAKTINMQGREIVVTPHKVDEVTILRNLGINAPSPIMYYYKWAGMYEPYQHQKITSAFLTMNRRGLVLNEIGTGKTQSALWAADYLMESKTIQRCLIVSPLSTLERVWDDAIFMNFPHRKSVILHGTASKRIKLLQTNADFFIVNHDGFNIIADTAKDIFDLLIVDEAAVYRTPSTKRFRILRKWIEHHPDMRLWLMTGTPTPNEPTDAWALSKLVGSPYVTKTYTAFKELVMMKVGQWRWLPRPESIDIVKKTLQPAIRYARDECFDLPPTVYQTRKADLTPEQNKHYKAMLKTFVTELSTEGTITAVNEAVKMQKLIQIACGVAYGDDGRHIELACTPRVNLVKEIIEEVGNKVIIFVPLTGTLKMLDKELSKHWSVDIVNGEVSSSKRSTIFNNFQNAVDPHVLIAHPATMAHGLTLTAADTIVWYGPITSNEQYVQANGRIERIGKKYSSNVIHIESTDLEYKMYERLRKKQRLQGLLLDLIQTENKEDN